MNDPLVTDVASLFATSILHVDVRRTYRTAVVRAANVDNVLYVLRLPTSSKDSNRPCTTERRTLRPGCPTTSRAERERVARDER